MSAIKIESTTATEAEATTIADQLIQGRLAACVQVTGPIRSYYRWNNNIESDEEWRLSIKTVRAKYQAIERRIRQLHSYDEPQIIAIAIETGSQGYLAWLQDQVDS